MLPDLHLQTRPEEGKGGQLEVELQILQWEGIGESYKGSGNLIKIYSSGGWLPDTRKGITGITLAAMFREGEIKPVETISSR